MKKYWPILLLLLLSFWAIKPLFHSGFFPIHDDTQVVRVQQMTQALRDGQFPVRWVADLGYGFGYPIFNFYAPLAYYLGAFFNLIGFNALLATKLMFMIGILLAGVSMYFLAREFWGEIGGIVSGLFYVYAPYHAVDIYVRGAVGEFLAMAFLPLVFLSVYKLFDLSPSKAGAFRRVNGLKAGYKRIKWVVLGSLSLAAVILSHNLTAIMLAPFILGLMGYLGCFSKRKISIFLYFYIPILLLGLSLSAFYWLPALAEMNLTRVFGQIGGGADWRDHFVFLDQLWASPWGFGGSAPGRLDGMSFMIGKIHLLMVILAIPSLLMDDRLLSRKKKKQIWGILGALGVLAVAVFMTNKISQPIWETIPMMAFIQYPWRFLLFVALSASFMAGSVVRIPPSEEGIPRHHVGYGARHPPRRRDVLGSGIIVLALLFFNTKYFQPQFYNGLSNEEYINEERIKWETAGISDEYLPRDFPIPQSRNEVAWEKAAVLKGEAEIRDLILKSHRYSFEVRAEEGSEILINTAYFLGWRVWIDGKEIDPRLKEGKIVFTLPPGEAPDGASPGEYQISARFTNTPVRTIANLVSLFSWIGLIGFMLKYKGWMRLIWR